MSPEEEKSVDDLKKELDFYKNQTQVLREKNRDLRNAMLLSDSQAPSTEQTEEATQESLSDIRKIIADSKKQISEKLTRFKESIEDSNDASEVSSAQTSTSEITSSNSSAPSPPKFTAQMDSSSKEAKKDSDVAPVSSAETEAILYQIEYLKKEVDRLETFLEQSERVNSKLQQLLVENNIDISEITKAIDVASQTAISGTSIKKSEPASSAAKVESISPPVTETITKIEPTVEKEAELDPIVQKIFDEFTTKITSGINNEEITLGILEFRETLMNYIPHSRVFYEMQIEYRKWKKGTSSVNDLKDAMKEWAKTIASSI
ncbi:MAG: hypothetical protein ACFFDW_01750 [Candidatus Thorarchaeota archaeon]